MNIFKWLRFSIACQESELFYHEDLMFDSISWPNSLIEHGRFILVHRVQDQLVDNLIVSGDYD